MRAPGCGLCGAALVDEVAFDRGLCAPCWGPEVQAAPAPERPRARATSRLRVGQRVEIPGDPAPWVVEMVNDCRARVRSSVRETRVVHAADGDHAFRAGGRCMDISPNALVRVVA